MSQNINLYDPSLRQRRDLLDFDAATAFVVAAVVCVALGAAAAHWSLGRIEPVAAASATDLDAQRSAAQALAVQATATKPDTALQAEIAALQRTLLQRRAALQMLAGSTPDREGGFSAQLEALARQSVDGLWLTGMVLHQNDVLLKGRTLTPSLIPVYVQRLDQEPSLQGHAFKALDVSRPLNDATKTAPTPAPVLTASGDASDPVQHAEYVEFTLVGSAPAEQLVADKGVRR